MKPEERFIKYFSKFQPLLQEEKDAILKDLDIRCFKKGDIILEEGKIAKNNYFIIEGGLRQFYLYKGEEKTKSFFLEESWILPALDVEENTFSNYSLECIEDSKLVIGNNKSGNDLIKKFPRIQKISQLILEKEIVRQQDELMNYINNTPEERYLNMLKNEPKLINKITQYQLASFIGVQPESLSRIRRRIIEKNKNL